MTARGDAPGRCPNESAQRLPKTTKDFAFSTKSLVIGVELRGIEPLTSSMPWKRSTN